LNEQGPQAEKIGVAGNPIAAFNKFGARVVIDPDIPTEFRRKKRGRAKKGHKNQKGDAPCFKHYFILLISIHWFIRKISEN